MRLSNKLAIGILAFGCMTALGSGAVRAQDAAKVAPTVYKVVLENEHVRVMVATVKPGEKVPMHSHPASVIYPLNASKVKFTSPDGKSIEVDMKPGAASWHEPETHAPENIGTAEARVLVIEMKDSTKKP
jgi:quercetin dioxygenase-like cupin family protein